MYCGECGQECDTEVNDYGIGGFEYCGAQGCDTQEALVSTCCEAPVFRDPALKHEYDYADYDEDCRAAAAEDREENRREREYEF